MRRLDYGTQLSPLPITLSVGTIKKPTLRDVAEVTFDVFDHYETLLKVTPELLLSQVTVDDKTYWEILSDKEKESITMLDILCADRSLADDFVRMLGFFFVEPVVFYNGCFVFLNCDMKNDNSYSDKDIRGIISVENYKEVFNILQQICCIDDKDDYVDDSKFKNSVAKKLFEKMKKGKKKPSSKNSINYTLPNLISAVSTEHPSINITNIWDLTIYQLIDTFNRLSNKAIYQIDSTRVSVWGDEKKTFDSALWYKNEFDKK